MKSATAGTHEGVLELSQPVEQVTRRCQAPPSSLLGREATKDKKKSFTGIFISFAIRSGLIETGCKVEEEAAESIF